MDPTRSREKRFLPMIVLPVRSNRLIVDETMKNMALDPPGDLEIVAEAYNTWEIHNFSKLGHRNLSPEFECAGYKWYT